MTRQKPRQMLGAPHQPLPQRLRHLRALHRACQAHQRRMQSSIPRQSSRKPPMVQQRRVHWVLTCRCRLQLRSPPPQTSSTQTLLLTITRPLPLPHKHVSISSHSFPWQTLTTTQKPMVAATRQAKSVALAWVLDREQTSHRRLLWTWKTRRRANAH